MNDIYEAFATAAVENYQSKQEPKRTLKQRDDIETTPIFNSKNGRTRDSKTSSFQNLKGKLFSQNPLKSQLVQEQASKPVNFVIGKMDDKSDYTKAIIAFGIGALLLMSAVFNLPTIIFSPQIFTSLFTLSMICMLFGLAFLNGPANYARKLTEKKNILASSVLMLSIVLSLYFSIIQGSYLLSLTFCFVELNAIILFFFNTFPAARIGSSAFEKTAQSMLTSTFK